jgi:multiple sugar transport system substrate-binding protein
MRRVRRLAAATTAVLGVAALAASVASGVGAQTRAETINVLDNGAHPQYKGVWAKIPEFEKKYGINVNLTLGSTTEVTEQKALQSVELGGGTYDVVTIPDEITAAAAPFMTDLTPLITASGGSVKAIQSPQPAWAQKADTFKGKLIYKPFYAGAHAVVYRVGLFKNTKNKRAFEKQFHYPLPNPPKTPKQLMDVAKFFNSPSRAGIVLPGQGALGGGLAEEMLFLSGLNYTTAQGKALWSSDFPQNRKLAITAITWFKNLLEYAPSQITGMQSTSAAAYFDQCKSAMYMDLSYLTWGDVASKQAQAQCGPVSSFPIPTFTKNGGHIVSFWMHGIPANSSHKQAAWQFIQWLDSQANLKLASQGPNGTFVPTDATARKSAVAAYKIPYGVAAAVEGGIPYPILATTTQYRHEVINVDNEELVGGTMTPTQFVDQTAKGINDVNHVSG